MERVKGIGGIFFKAQDPDWLAKWYQQHLGLKTDSPEAPVIFNWRYADDPDKSGMTVWTPFPHDTDHFNPSRASFMMNYIVADLDGLLEALRREGVTVDDKRDDSEFGKFGWIMDPEGNRIELWQPPADEPGK